MAISKMPIEDLVPKVVNGAGAVTQVGTIYKEWGLTTPLVVTDSELMKLGLLDGMLDSLRAEGIQYVVYDKVTPDPTLNQVENGASIYRENNCDGLIAFGGGSSMDCAKCIGALITHPISAKQLSDPGMVKQPIPPLLCIPTTAGTGSETTFAAVVRDDALQIKHLVVSITLFPKVAVLDPELLRNLPNPITAATGMDAMTHAVESYLSCWNHPKVDKYSEQAVMGLCNYLKRSYDDGNDMEAREGVMKAAYDAGVAISLAGVGYIHAIAHQMGGLFHTPHGVANAMIMPKVLDFYLTQPYGQAVDRLAHLANLIGLAEGSNESKLTLATKFVAKIREMNASMDMPQTVNGLKRNDVDVVVARALAEAHGTRYNILWNPLLWLQDAGYSIPTYLDEPSCKAIVKQLIPEDAQMRAKM